MLLMYRFALRPDTLKTRIHVLGSHRGFQTIFIFLTFRLFLYLFKCQMI
jgi:hypothetical protein